MNSRNEDKPQSPSEIMDQLSKWGEMVNGMKNQLTNNGWSEENAQELVKHILLNSEG